MHERTCRCRIAALAAAALLAWLLSSAVPIFVAPAAAEEPNPALFEGTDRAARILAGARKEGTLTLYGSMAEKDLRRLVSDFERRYGIKVNVWRAGKDKVLQRVVAEAAAGRFAVDFIHNPSPEMEALHREKLLQEVHSPVHRNVIPAAIPAHREWVGGRIYVFVLEYNTSKVKAEELPKSYRDLLDPRWKGRLGIEAKQGEWFYTMLKEMGEENGLRLFRDLAATNGFSIRDGSALLNNLVVAGEVPLAVTMYSYLAEQSRRAGAPVNYFTLQPTIAYTDGMAVAKRAPHPYAAMLFYDFVFTEGETLLTEMDHVTTNRRNEAMLARFQPKYIDVGAVLDGYEKWEKLYQDTIQGRGAK